MMSVCSFLRSNKLSARKADSAPCLRVLNQLPGTTNNYDCWERSLFVGLCKVCTLTHCPSVLIHRCRYCAFRGITAPNIAANITIAVCSIWQYLHFWFWIAILSNAYLRLLIMSITFQSSALSLSITAINDNNFTTNQRR